LWKLLHTAASIDVTWINTLAANLDNIKLKNSSSPEFCTHKDCTKIRNIYDNPFFVKNLHNRWYVVILEMLINIFLLL
jgi:hypothetical protein